MKFALNALPETFINMLQVLKPAYIYFPLCLSHIWSASVIESSLPPPH